MEKTIHSQTRNIILLIVILGVIQGYAFFRTQQKLTALTGEVTKTKNTLTMVQDVTASSTKENSQKLLELSDMLYEEQLRFDDLKDDVRRFDKNVGKLSDSVDTLEKISTTDPELLQKYSKVYFLNEHYGPSDLEVVEEKYDYENGKEVSVHAEVWPFLEDLLDEARDDDVDLLVLSGFRSFGEQMTLKGEYTVTYGSGANAFSADQGYSEHQLGTTVDFTTSYNGSNLDAFEGTEAHAWLLKYAYKYGFTMSYPQDNQYYEYEPWHWRFVGEDLAKYLHRNEKHFYDLEQREIDKYIPELFD